MNHANPAQADPVDAVLLVNLGTPDTPTRA
jgi:protoheme ferro-lyase